MKLEHITQGTGDTQDDEVRRVLGVLQERHPELTAVVSLLGGDLRVSKDFVDGLRSAKSISYGKRSLVLRALLADTSVGVAARHARVTAPVLDRLIDWWEHHGALDTGAGSRELIPKHLGSMFGVARTDFDLFVSVIASRPWKELRSGRTPTLAAYAGLAADDLAPLRRIHAARTLTADRAAFMASAEGTRDTRGAQWFFDTGDASLDLQNALVFLEALFCDRDGGRAQSRLPVTLTARWGLRRLNLPEAIAFADVASLAAAGAIDVDAVADEWMGLREALALPMPPEIVSRHVLRWCAGGVRSVELQSLREDGSRGGQFDTSFMFNVCRLAALPPFASREPDARMTKLAAYYAAARRDALSDIYLPHWRSRHAEFDSYWPAIRAVAADGSAIRIRDLGNIVAHLVATDSIHEQRAAWEALPSVARYALGVSEPRSGASSRLTTVPARARSATAPARSLPMLADLVAAAPRLADHVYLVTPTYAGELPVDGVVYIHRAHAAGIVPPAGLIPIGHAPLPWGTDVVADAKGHLRSIARSVTVLS